jgi:glycosyltransferase involved in cell wall biosynthesis
MTISETAAEPDAIDARTRADFDGPLRVLGVDPELGFAGGEAQVLALTLELVRAGHRAELACDARGRLFARARDAGITCHPLAIRNAVDFAAGMRLRAMLSRGRYDIVHFHTSRAHSMAPMVRGCARAAVVTRRMDYPPNRIFAPYLYNRAVDAVAAISRPVADALIESGVAREHVTIVPSGVDCERFRPPTAAEREHARARLAIAPGELAIAPGELAIGTVGMLEERKGHRYLLEAIASLSDSHPQLRCLIAGAGSMKDQLERHAAELGISARVAMLGMVADSRAVLDALDVFVFPSLKEGLGVAMLEAMACGLAVVASRAGGIADAVEDVRSGVLVPPGDSAAIAAAIARLADDPGLRSTLGAAARERVAADFSTGAMARKTIELYRACLSRRAAIGGRG